MAHETLGQRLAQAYIAFRCSYAFLYLYFGWVITWLILHWTLGIDPLLDELNMQLSVEAGVTTTLLVVDIARAEKARAIEAAARAHQADEMHAMMRSLQAVSKATQTILEGQTVLMNRILSFLERL